MGEISFLLSSYSGGELIIILAAVVFAVVAVFKAWDYLWEKIKIHFGNQTTEQNWHEKIENSLASIQTNQGEMRQSIEELKTSADERGQRLKQVEEYTQKDYEREEKMEVNINEIKKSMDKFTSRLQNDTRYEFIEAHQHYCKEIGKIDYLTLQALTHKYEDYKADGGNSFVDSLWKDIQELDVVRDGVE